MMAQARTYYEKQQADRRRRYVAALIIKLKLSWEKNVNAAWRRWNDE